MNEDRASVDAGVVLRLALAAVMSGLAVYVGYQAAVLGQSPPAWLVPGLEATGLTALLKWLGVTRASRQEAALVIGAGGGATIVVGIARQLKTVLERIVEYIQRGDRAFATLLAPSAILAIGCFGVFLVPAGAKRAVEGVLARFPSRPPVVQVEPGRQEPLQAAMRLKIDVADIEKLREALGRVEVAIRAPADITLRTAPLELKPGQSVAIANPKLEVMVNGTVKSPLVDTAPLLRELATIAGGLDRVSAAVKTLTPGPSLAALQTTLADIRTELGHIKTEMEASSPRSNVRGQREGR